MKTLTITIALVLTTLLSPTATSAHQPRVVTESPTVVISPEVSKAYYSKLSGEPAVYTISSSKSFALYVGLLVPDIVGQKRDVSAVILKDGKEVEVLDGTNFEWEQYSEPFGRDTYWKGPEYKAEVEAGNYEIRVWSSNNDSKYSLAVGETEAFDFKETMNALSLIPELKKDFFNKSPIDFILSPFGYGLILIMFVLAFVFGFIYRAILRKLARKSNRGVGKNIDKNGRILRAAVGVALLLIAITTSWSPWLLFFSGFAFFEAIFSWCGLYAVLGRNTCPIN